MAHSDISADNAGIACSLDATDLPRRVAEWRSLLGHVVERTPIEDELRVRFGSGVDAAAVADLAARERACCSFFEFSLHLERGGMALDVRAPAEAKELVEMLFEAHEPAAARGGSSSSACGCGDKDHNAEQTNKDAE